MDFSVMLNNSRITLKNHFRYLVVFINTKLNFQFHPNVVANKLFSAAGILYKLKHVLPLNALLELYYLLVHPHLLTDWWCGVSGFPPIFINLFLFKIKW